MKRILSFIFISFCTVTYAQNTIIDTKFLVEKKEVMYYNGSPFTGKCFENFSNGKTVVEGSYKNGKMEGTWTWYYENGLKKRLSNYRNGELHGLSIVWYPNGKKRSELQYERGKNIIEKQQRWNENGNLLPPATFNKE